MKNRTRTYNATLRITRCQERSPWRRYFLLVPVVFAWLAFSPIMLAVDPPPDGGYANENTAEGDFALFSLSIGSDNTAIGNGALFRNTTGSFNTASGASALESNTTGSANTANGYESLFSNTTGIDNAANGVFALFDNTTGSYNTATGDGTMEFNSTGSGNTATGFNALYFNTAGTRNTATGAGALYSNKTGVNNTANGYNALHNNTNIDTAAGNNNTANGVNALYSNTTGINNTATGVRALYSTTGSNNIGVGYNAGASLTTGSGNVCLGSGVLGVAGESNTTRIKNVYSSVASGRAVYVNSDNKIGTLVSSRRFKDEIKPMDKASEAILSLKPVTFRYKQELDPKGIPQFGLVAEEVEKVNPDLVARDDQGNVYTVRYEAVNAMLLNEFLKEHRTVQELKSTAAKQEAIIARQQKQIDALTTGLRKVSAQLELNKPARQMVSNNQ